MKPAKIRNIEEETTEILKAHGIKMYVYELDYGGVKWPLYMFEYIPKSGEENK